MKSKKQPPRRLSMIVALDDGVEPLPDEDSAHSTSIKYHDQQKGLAHIDTEHCWCEPRLEPILDQLEEEIVGYYSIHNTTLH
jgi:hypothetical protein